MKQKRFHRITSTLCALALLLSLLPAASAAGTPTASKNINAQDYATYGSTVKSYLYENSQGGVTRVEYTGGSVVVEDYDSSFRLQSSRTVSTELSTWGGFYAGSDANYLIFGQNNSGHSNSAEVIRVVKYSKDWQRQGQASLNGANTAIPFDAGSLRCDEYGEYLYVRTCHEMYNGHQANLTIAVRESDMTVADSYYEVMNSSVGYVSHSFNQFVLIDQQQRIVTLDHGDTYPRAAVLMVYKTGAGQGKFSGSASNATVQSFAGSAGQNVTGASLGGLEETSSGYVTAYNYNGTAASQGDRAVYLSYTDKSSLKTTASKVSSSGGTTPVLASTGLSGGYVLWNGKSGSTVSGTLYYASYDASGSAGQVKTAQAPLSDCQPIMHGGKAVWYVTNNSAPTFYGLDDSGVTVLGGGSGGSGAAQTPGTPSTPGAPSTSGAATGSCGKNVTCSFSDGTLTIQGTGPMYSYWGTPESLPWYSYSKQIQTVIVSDGVTKIGGDVFWQCSSLTSVTIPSSVTSLDEAAFIGCTSLTDVYYSGSESQWNQAIGGSYGVESNAPLRNVAIHFNSAGSSSAGTPADTPSAPGTPSATTPEASGSCGANVTWSYSNSTLTIQGTGPMADYPEDLPPWSGVGKIETIKIGDGVASVGASAFYGLMGLTSVSIPSSVTSIGDYAFYMCWDMTSITIPDGVVSIGKQAFQDCTYLTRIDIPKSVTTIGYGAFSVCTHLKDVYYGGGKDDWARIEIDNQHSSNEKLLNAAIHYSSAAPASTPTTPAATPTPQASSVMLSPQKLTVDGKSADCEKYNIDGSNYFKLRDLAYLLNGTSSQFGVGFDAATGTVTITTGAAYTSNGTEIKLGKDNAKTTQPSSQTILIDGVERGDLNVYNIGGSNFFKLRDLGTALGFDVDFDASSNTAVVRSTQK